MFGARNTAAGRLSDAIGAASARAATAAAARTQTSKGNLRMRLSSNPARHCALGEHTSVATFVATLRLASSVPATGNARLQAIYQWAGQGSNLRLGIKSPGGMVAARGE